MKSEKRYVKSTDVGIFDRMDRLSQIEQLETLLNHREAEIGQDPSQEIIHHEKRDTSYGARRM